MRTKSIILAIFLLLFSVNCSKPETTDTNDSTSGVVNFWTKNTSRLPFSITLNGQEKFITQSYAAQPSGCQGNVGTAFFDMPPGNYNVIVKDVNGTSTTLSHSVTAGGCIQYQLTP